MDRYHSYIKYWIHKHLSKCEIHPICMLPQRCRIFNLDECEVENSKWVKFLRWHVTTDKIRNSTHKNGKWQNYFSFCVDTGNVGQMLWHVLSPAISVINNVWSTVAEGPQWLSTHASLYYRPIVSSYEAAWVDDMYLSMTSNLCTTRWPGT